MPSMLFALTSLAMADFRSMMLVEGDCEGRVRLMGGERRDLRVMVRVAGVLGGREVGSRRRMGWEVRGRVYWGEGWSVIDNVRGGGKGRGE